MAQRATPAAPAQAALLLDAPRPPKVAIVGQLERHAELRCSVDGSAHLIVQVLQPRDSLAFVAIRHVKADEADDLRVRAASMNRGCTVIVLGSGITLGQHDGNHVLRLRTVRDIVLAHRGEYFTELDGDGA